MVSSVSFRRGFVKVKRNQQRPRQRPKAEVPAEDDEMIGEEARPSRPLQMRMPRPVAQPKPWWSHWRTILAVVGIGIAGTAGIYAIGKSVRFDDGYRAQRHVAGGGMGYPTRASGDFLPGKGTPGQESWGSLSDYSAPTDQSFIDTFGTGRSRRSGSAPAPARTGGGAQPAAPAPATAAATAAAPGEKIVLDQNASGSCAFDIRNPQGLQDCFRSRSAAPRQ